MTKRIVVHLTEDQFKLLQKTIVHTMCCTHEDEKPYLNLLEATKQFTWKKED